MEYTNQDVRRQDRLLDEARAFEILKEGEFGILSMRTEEGDGVYGIPIFERFLKTPLRLI